MSKKLLESLLRLHTHTHTHTHTHNTIYIWKGGKLII